MSPPRAPAKEISIVPDPARGVARTEPQDLTLLLEYKD